MVNTQFTGDIAEFGFPQLPNLQNVVLRGNNLSGDIAGLRQARPNVNFDLSNTANQASNPAVPNAVPNGIPSAVPNPPNSPRPLETKVRVETPAANASGPVSSITPEGVFGIVLGSAVILAILLAAAIYFGKKYFNETASDEELLRKQVNPRPSMEQRELLTYAAETPYVEIPIHTESQNTSFLEAPIHTETQEAGLLEATLNAGPSSH